LQPDAVERGLLQPAVAVRLQVTVTELAERDLGPLHRDSLLRRFAAVSDEGDNIDAGRDGEESLLDPHQQVIDLRGGRFRLVPSDPADGEGLTLAVVAEVNAEAAIALLQGGRECPSGKGNATPMSGSPLYQN
jgi:hypothetical protein